ncbi:hypothetical protein QBC34DRAFT_457707 [Podospora aff. communis PSN243]|uniref:F-box domain-containing protein n=1 Tax=Podospora aff. communis PSN243 TaxID=3040156 RepID=A0AAV9GUK1_9PEZI|nr:hypothetical protein QBC34DRAFT_457707 [Podospora aff. communis PSN243]
MPKPDPAIIASQLEQLPLELFEPILENLSFRDVIALAKYAPEGSRLAAALETSPMWRDIWPTYKANADDFQTLVSLNRADRRQPHFHRRLVREQTRHGPNFSFYDSVCRTASETIQIRFQFADPITRNFICQKISLGDIALICPWLKNMVVAAQQRHASAQAKAVQVVRERFLDAMEGMCRCVPSWSFYTWGTDRSRTLKWCSVKHQDRKTPEWTVSQMKAFVSAYSVLQRQLNTTKASQLQTLAKLYTRHPTRLKEALAPQGPRYNIHHIPNQLEIVSRFVMRIIDIDRRSVPGTKQGTSKFRFVHPCLIPYDWCLQLWFKVNEVNSNVKGVLPWPISVDGVKQLEHAMGRLSLSPSEPQPPSEVMSQIQAVNGGIERFFKRSSKWGPEGYAALRTQVAKSDGKSTDVAVPVIISFLGSLN